MTQWFLVLGIFLVLVILILVLDLVLNFSTSDFYG